jgi:hypothetical protein
MTYVVSQMGKVVKRSHASPSGDSSRGSRHYSKPRLNADSHRWMSRDVSEHQSAR